MAHIASLTGEEWLSRYPEELDGKVVVRVEATDKGSHTAGGYNSRSVLEPTVFINNTLFAHGMAPLYHELCHVICQDYHSITLREGLASYMHDEISDIPTVFNYGMDPDLIVCNIILSKPENQNLITEMGAFDLEGDTGRGDQRTEYYVCAYSFAKFLIGAFGMDAFMELYGSESEDAYSLLTGHTLAELRDAWVQKLAAESGLLDEQTYQTYLDELTAEHGLS